MLNIFEIFFKENHCDGFGSGQAMRLDTTDALITCTD